MRYDDRKSNPREKQVLKNCERYANLVISYIKTAGVEQMMHQTDSIYGSNRNSYHTVTGAGREGGGWVSASVSAPSGALNMQLTNKMN